MRWVSCGSSDARVAMATVPLAALLARLRTARGAKGWQDRKRVVAMRRDMRASDAEREAAVALLTKAVGEGRITMAEFEERSRGAYAATTRGELDTLIDDLPRSLW